MKPVNQTTFGNPGGNCFSACVASILELNISDVPNFMGHEEWWPPFVEWCGARGVKPVWHDRRPEFGGDPSAPPPSGYSIMSGQSPRHPAPAYHSVVALDGVMVHDPRADDPRGLLDPIIDFITLEPVR